MCKNIYDNIYQREVSHLMFEEHENPKRAV